MTPESKDTNPKDAVGTRKVPMSCVPLRPIMELGLAMLEGARKYGRHNYRAVGVRSSVYFDAALRHLFAWWEGEDLDPESGLPHVIKAMACLVVVRDAELQELLTDDRPPRVEPGWVAKLNAQAAALLDRLPDAREPYVAAVSPTAACPKCAKAVPVGELVGDSSCWTCESDELRKAFGPPAVTYRCVP